jgi:hypothetical protein
MSRRGAMADSTIIATCFVRDGPDVFSRADDLI